MAPASIIMMALIIYTGFTIPITDMHPWFRWINYINPIAYAFETLMLNEFNGRQFPCITFIPSGPGYTNITGTERICATGISERGSFASSLCCWWHICRGFSRMSPVRRLTET
ncbi:hypothetical protein BT96DRAFT_431072 [Gymnopus androsaceus JB14]|uniref:ABC-2 type transporter transmembrane domain-containing protein n=1 Tax=Gymnopus androsaceus JB14 TaxID=1447944 RepID=A0A6A4GS80_9AGAR|nr:hypothetical protein BT96DRAFT_431072 [Gymnopus androsaceus JB14]